MKRLALFALGLSLALTFSFSLIGSALAQGPETTPIQGQLVNGTRDGPVPANVSVTLAEPTEEGKELAKTTTDAQGRFQFADFVAQAGAKYKIKLNYQGADYEADWPPEDASKGLTITVYEATTDPSAISITSWHIIVQPGQGSLDVDEFMVFENKSDRAYVGSQVVDTQGRKATLKFSLPKGAYGFQYMQGLMECCMVPSASGLVDTMAVLPGSKEIFFHYFVDYKGGDYELARPVDYPAADVRVLTPATGPKVTSSLLADQRTVTDEKGASYLSLATSNLNPGVTVTASFTGLAKKGLQSNLRWLGVGVLVLAVGGIGLAYPRLRRRAAAHPSQGRVRAQGSERERLLLEVAELDNRYEQGEVPGAEYQARRKVLIDLLVYLGQQEEGSE